MRRVRIQETDLSEIKPEKEKVVIHIPRTVLSQDEAEEFFKEEILFENLSIVLEKAENAIEASLEELSKAWIAVSVIRQFIEKNEENNEPEESE